MSSANPVALQGVITKWHPGTKLAVINEELITGGIGMEREIERSEAMDRFGELLKSYPDLMKPIIKFAGAAEKSGPSLRVAGWVRTVRGEGTSYVVCAVFKVFLEQ